MKLSFEGKVALVTGASQGIGFASAQAFAEAGATVVLADRDEQKVCEATRALTVAGHQALAVTCDVTQPAQVKAMMARVVAAHGQLDAAFNNAGVISDTIKVLDTGDEEFDRLVSVNLRGVWLCMKAELEQMLKQGGGTIVNCSSIGGLAGSLGHGAYAATKHGVTGLTRSAALEYITQGVRINAVAPGMIDTPMHLKVSRNHDPEVEKEMLRDQPIGRFGKPSEVAAAVLWLCSEASSLVVGHVLPVDGGFMAR